MITQASVAAVTGAGGYLGSQICLTLESKGWQVIRLTGSGVQRDGEVVRYKLAEPITQQVTQALRSADVLIHAAYDLSLTRAIDIWSVNVEGTLRLLRAANSVTTKRIVVLSSMSAFAGTSQLYGRAKLDIEAMTIEAGGCALRPGLVHSKRAGGMAGAIRKLTALPIVPVIGGDAGVYTVWEGDLMEAISMLASAKSLEPGTLSVAHPQRVTMATMLSVFAARENRRCRLVPVPWRLPYWVLKGGELMSLQLPFRADSLLGLVRTAPCLVGQEQLARLGVTIRAFDPSYEPLS
jgi:nucleoside-diphosphate-sugar epimerase